MIMVTEAQRREKKPDLIERVLKEISSAIATNRVTPEDLKRFEEAGRSVKRASVPKRESESIGQMVFSPVGAETREARKAAEALRWGLNEGLKHGSEELRWV